jgi:hypothetical protein
MNLKQILSAFVTIIIIIVLYAFVSILCQNPTSGFDLACKSLGFVKSENVSTTPQPFDWTPIIVLIIIILAYLGLAYWQEWWPFEPGSP